MNVELSALNIHKMYQSHLVSSETERNTDTVAVYIQSIDPLR